MHSEISEVRRRLEEMKLAARAVAERSEQEKQQILSQSEQHIAQQKQQQQDRLMEELTRAAHKKVTGINYQWLNTALEIKGINCQWLRRLHVGPLKPDATFFCII